MRKTFSDSCGAMTNAREKRFNMLLSTDEEFQLRWLAKQEGLTASAYLRMMIHRAYKAPAAVAERKAAVGLGPEKHAAEVARLTR